jgi:Tol biopolymer transport system component
MVSVLDGSVGFLKAKGSKPSRSRFSPDGRYIAYHFGEWGTLEIAVLTIDGTRETPVVQHPANDVLFDWTPDGKRLWFGSDRSGTMGTWWIQVADGQPAGSPGTRRPSSGSCPYGAASLDRWV